MSYLKINNVFKSYDQKRVLNNISLDIEEGEFLCLLGPSGRELKKNSFDVHYFPKSNDKSFEINEVAEMLLEELEYIEIDGDLVRGTNMNFEIVDNVLHFFVDYNYFTIKSNDTDKMDTVELFGGLKRGDNFE
ncbi:TPA: hypothetical protein KN186_001018 [Clostridioides difficile]|nr:hypothetical protein [Clostridioides difficile]HBF3257594.1 hypothetical protein [Clostridioides difficile]HBF9941794.1 hypothetical protein [Clostridioides difficile]HBF9954948.1 hypothetical protein [Clostridioides difficile]